MSLTIDLGPANVARPQDIRMTERREQVLRFVSLCYEQNGCPPGQREIAEACGMVVSTVNHHLRLLVALGRLRRGPRKSYIPVNVVPPQDRRVQALEAVAAIARPVAHLHPELAAALAELDGEVAA